jgi:uncharacterized protein (TIGR03083 family)
MTLDFDAHLARESDAFLEAVLAADPDARVPGCPEWTADDLLSHLARVQQFWAHVLRTRPAAPDSDQEPERPADRAGLEAYYRAASADLRAQLAAAPDDEEAWTWHDSIHTVGFIRRRQAHEALIHRVDAEQAASRPSSLDPALAADGVLECIDWMYAGRPSWGSFTSTGERIFLEPTDVMESRVLVGLGRFTGTVPDSGAGRDDDDVELLSASSTDPADVVVSGTAADLDLWLWHRGPLKALTVTGDDAVFARLSAILGQPIN